MVLMTDSRPLSRGGKYHTVGGWVRTLFDRLPVGGGRMCKAEVVDFVRRWAADGFVRQWVVGSTVISQSNQPMKIAY